MKEQTKRKILLIAVVAMTICAFAFALTACNPPAEEGVKTVSVIIGDGSDPLSLTTESAYLYDALVELCEKEGLTLSAKDGAWGKTVYQIGDLIGDPTMATSAIMFYHDIDDITLYDPKYDVTVGGQTYHSSSLGVSSLPVRDGATYLIRLEYFG